MALNTNGVKQVPRGTRHLDSATKPVDGGEADGRPGSGGGPRLLRYCHIFASAVRDVLEAKPLQEASPGSLTPSQFHLLKLMSFDGRHQVGEVADFLGVSAPAATKNIDKLERLGLMVRTPSKGDRRATLLSVSRKGRRLVRKYEELQAARLYPALEHFRPKEIAQFTRLLERFSVSLLEVDPPGERFCLRCSAHLEEGCSVGQTRGGCPYREVRGRHRPRATAEKV